MKFNYILMLLVAFVAMVFANATPAENDEVSEVIKRDAEPEALAGADADPILKLKIKPYYPKPPKKYYPRPPKKYYPRPPKKYYPKPPKKYYPRPPKKYYPKPPKKSYPPKSKQYPRPPPPSPHTR